MRCSFLSLILLLSGCAKDNSFNYENESSNTVTLVTVTDDNKVHIYYL